VERVFSVCGDLTTGKRNRLINKLENRAFLKINYKHYACLTYSVAYFTVHAKTQLMENMILYQSLGVCKLIQNNCNVTENLYCVQCCSVLGATNVMITSVRSSQ